MQARGGGGGEVRENWGGAVLKKESRSHPFIVSIRALPKEWDVCTENSLTERCKLIYPHTSVSLKIHKIGKILPFSKFSQSVIWFAEL